MSTIVLFNGLDSNFNSELWETNGTLAGTIEITPGAAATQGGINPYYLTAFNGEALFEGIDPTGAFGLWVTDGTDLGTYELTGIINANPSGLAPSNFQVYDGEVLFRGEAGVAGDDVPGLWITNGTAAGTYEIGGIANTGINNVYGGGLLPGNPDFTVFDGQVLFQAQDAVGNVGLWTTNGTAAGTYEIANIAGAMTVGPPGSFGSDIQPRYMVVLGNEVIFDGADQQDTPGSLWETNGTASGTIEIGGQGNAGITGAPNGFSGPFTSELALGIQPYDLTLFNNKVIFAGYDSTLRPNGYYADTDALWITDGTASGTVEIGGLGNATISGANPAVSGGIFWSGSIEYPDFTVFNGKVLFVGYDASGHVGLWETDGTAAGTVEIGGLGNAGISGGLTLLGSQSPDFTVFNGEVLFNAIDSQGHSDIWVTNGTAAGTFELDSPNLGAPPATLGPDFTVTTLGLAVTALTAVSETGATTVNAGHLIAVTMDLNHTVTVTGTPTLQLNDNEVAYYTAGSGSNALTFVYAPVPTDNVADLQVTGLNLPSGASITDASGNSLSNPVTGDLGLSIAGKLTPATVAQEINGLYLSLYGLAATAAGITYWENVLSNFDPSVTTANAASTEISLNDQTYLGEQMTAGSPIVNGTTYFATLYPTSMSDMAFVEALYQNMSDFVGTVAGDNYWLNLLQQTEASNGGNVIAARESVAGQFVHDFLSNDLTVGAAALGVSQSDYTLLVNGQQALLNKVVVSQYYADATQVSGGSLINYTSVTDAAFTASHNVAASITDNPTTIVVAVTGINNAIAHQDLSLI